MTTSPVNCSVLGSGDLARDHFAANFAPVQVEKVIWEAPIIRNVTGPADLENYDGADYKAINSSQIAALDFANGKDINYLWRLPNDIDTAKDVEFNLLVSNSEAVDVAKFSTITTVYKATIVGTSTIAIAATAVTSEMSTIANVGANIFQQATTWAKIAGATFAAAGLTRGKDCLNLMFTNAITGAADLSVYKILARFWVKQISGGV